MALTTKTMDQLNNMRKKGTLCDVTLIVEGQLFPAHRNVLAASSEFFCRMFTTPMLESTSHNVELRCTDPKTIDLLLEFIYTTQISIDNSNVDSLIKASNQFLIEPLKEMCEQFLIERVNATNCLDLFGMADYLICPELKEVAQDFLLLHFADSYQQDTFLQLHLTQLVQLLSQDKLVVQSEAQVYDAAIRWLKYMPNRKPHVAEVLGCVRFPLLPKDFLCMTVQSEPLIQDTQQCLDTLNCELLSRPRCKESVIAVFGGPHFLSTYHFNPKDCTWAEICRSSVKSRDVSAAVSCDNIVYIIGGKRSYSVSRKEWKLLPASTPGRDFMAACASEGKIYTSGGSVSKLSERSFECYDPKSKSWQTQCEMLFQRYGHGSVEANGLIYVCGGTRENYAGNSTNKECEVYNPSTRQWRQICPMNEARMNHGLVVIGNRIYALGGQNIRGPLNSVEYYEIASNKWHTATKMPLKVSNVKCAAIGRIIYVLAGVQHGRIEKHRFSNERPPTFELKHILQYLTHADRWVICNKTQAFPYNCAACVIHAPDNVTQDKRTCFKTFSTY